VKGVFGGNFDPVHIGHLIVAIDAVRILGLEKVLFVPTWISPFKKDIKTTPFHHRFEMLCLATENNPFFEVLGIEGRRKGISYTYDTLKELKEKESELCLLIGEDQAEEFASWHRWNEIIEIAEVYVLRRSKSPKEYPPYLNPLQSKIIEISSTEIRNAISDKEPVDYYLPYRVFDYIKKHGLYKNSGLVDQLIG